MKQAEYQIVFKPQGSRNSQVIFQRKDAFLSNIRAEDSSLDGYYFLNKDEKIIQRKYQTKYKIQDILKSNQIIMSKNQQIKTQKVPHQINKQVESGSIEIYLVFQNQNRKDMIKVQLTTTLEQLLKQHQGIEEYYFLNKNKNPIKPIYNKKYTIEQIKQGNQIILRKKQESKQGKIQQKIFQIQFKNSKQKKIQIKTFDKQIIANLRKNTQLQNFIFLSQNGQRISQASQEKFKIQDICVKNVIYMKAKFIQKEQISKSQNKRKQVLQQQKNRLESLGKLMKNIQNLKGDINKQGNQKRMKQISQQLKQQGIYLQPQKLSSEHQLSSILQTLKGKQMTCQNILEYAKKKQTSEAQAFQSNGLILPTIYNTNKKQNQTLCLVDFEKTKKLSKQKYKKGYKYSIIQYESDQHSNVTVDLSKTSQYQFNGGSLNVSLFSISSKVESGLAQLQQNQNVTTKRGVRKNQRVSQLFLAFAITQAIYFHQDDIFLKLKIIEQFQQIVRQFEESNDMSILRKNMTLFIDKYGIGISSSLYYLGGIYKNSINYQFFTQTTSDELTNIMRTETQFTLAVSAGGSYGPFSAEAGYERNTKNTQQKSKVDKKTNKKINYKTVYYHQAAPLSSIQDINIWRQTVESFPNNWVVVGYQEPIEISIIKLLRSKNNSINMKKEFLQCKEKVLQMMGSSIKSVLFKFQMEQNPNFLVYKTEIKKAGEPYKQYQILGKQHFPYQRVNHYTVDIIHSENMDIAIGICTPNCKNNEYSRPKLHEVIFYRLAGLGTIQYKNQQIKVNYLVKNGNKIKVVVDTTALSFISWTVQGNLVGQIQIPVEMLQKGIYPYFQMFKNNDVIRIN